jgi:hypothetical protein
LPASQRRLAVLIDADNFPPWAVERLLPEVEKLGDPVIRRIYGNISGTGSKRWADLSARFALVSRQQFVHSTGKNATDIVMVIDAMDILANDQADGFCLVSSDSDFTALATRLREGGRLVFGFGQTKTPDAFRVACHEFFLFDFKEEQSEGGEVVAFPRPAVAQAVPHIVAAIRKHATDDGWVPLSTVGTHLVQNIPDFRVKSYGVKTLKVLVGKTGRFEIEKAKGGILRIRERATDR